MLHLPASMVGLDVVVSDGSTSSLENNSYLDALPKDPIVTSICRFIAWLATDSDNRSKHNPQKITVVEGP